LTTDGSGNGTVSVEHNMGYAPAHFVFRKGTAQYTFLDASSYSNAFIPVGFESDLWMGEKRFNCYTTSTHLVINADGQDASTTYYFRYYLLVDLAEEFTGTGGIEKTNNFGLKISRDGYDVTTAEEYQMAYSQKYKSLQYYDENYKTQELSLPNFWASAVDTEVEAGTYVDILHGLGYPPFFLAFVELPADYVVDDIITNAPIPFYATWYQVPPADGGWMKIDGFCDANRVRVSFTEVSDYQGSAHEFEAITIKIKVFIFTEDLS
jgi:hypothetical protein